MCATLLHDADADSGQRPTEENTVIRRRRVCAGAAVGLFERIQLRELTIIKNTGESAFDRDKLMRSVQVALRKRPLAGTIERMVSGIVRRQIWASPKFRPKWSVNW